MQLFYLDRMLLALVCLFGSWAAVGTAHGVAAKIGSAVGIGIVFAALNALLARMRTTDAHPMLQQAARRIAQIFDVKVIVMGHSHRVVDEPIGGGARYLNLGSWTNAREGFPHVVVEDGVAQLRYWKGPSAQPAQIREEAPALPVAVPATA
jgi:hypothetical protein